MCVQIYFLKLDNCRGKKNFLFFRYENQDLERLSEFSLKKFLFPKKFPEFKMILNSSE